MNWYYAIATDRRGPVDQQQFDTLVRQGVVTHQTLVWREGMSDWQPYGVVVPGVGPVVSGGYPVTGFETCGLCGQVVSSSDMVAIGAGKYCAACKPVAVQRIKEGVSIVSGGEDLRRQYINHEASIRSVGFLYYLGASIFLVGAVGMLIMALMMGARTEMEARSLGGMEMMFVVIFMFAFSFLGFFIGRGYRKLKRWIRIPTAILSGIGLLSIPVGTLIHGYILYLVFSEKGKMVLSDEYQAVIVQTPNVKPSSPPILVVVFIIFAVLILIGVIASFVAR